MKSKKGTFLLIAVLLILLGGVAGAINGRSDRTPVVFENDTVVIGAIVPTEASPQSEALLLGIALAEESVRDFRVGRDLPDIEVLVRDSALDPETGKRAAEELAREGVDAIYSSHTVVTQEVTGISKENRTPLFYDSCNCGFAEENPYAFQMYFDPRKECREIAEDFKSRGIERAAFIGQDVPYGKFCYGEVQKVFGEENVEIELEAGQFITNYGFLLSQWEREGVGIVFSIPAARSFPFLFESNVSKGVNVPIACFEGACLTREIKDSVSEEALGNVIDFGFEIEKEFEERVLGTDQGFEREDVVAAAVAHDAVVHSWYLASYCGSDPVCMRETSRTANYPTAVISQGFDESSILIYKSRR